MQPGQFSAVVYAVLLHVVLLGFLTFSLGWRHFSQAAAQPPVLALQAVVVDERLIEAELSKLAAADERRIAAEEKRQRELNAQARQARAAREKEQQRLAEIERQRIAAERRAEAEANARTRDLQQQQEAEKQRLARLAEDRKLEEQRLAALAEQRREAETEARRKAAAEEQQRKEAEAERQRVAAAAAARQRANEAKETELQEQLRRVLAEESARRDAEESGLLDEYRTLIAQRIERNWNKPPGALPGLRCEVLLNQIPGGEVVDVRIENCNGDAAVLRSIEAAVYKASPLPSPPDPRLFERNVRVLFEPE